MFTLKYIVDAFTRTYTFKTWEDRETFLDEKIRSCGYEYGSDYTTHEEEE